MRNTIECFNKEKNDYIIPEWLFDERKVLFYDYRFQNQTKNLQKALSKSFLCSQIINVHSTLFRTLETLDHSFNLKIMLNTIAAWLMKVIVRVVKTMWMNP